MQRNTRKYTELQRNTHLFVIFGFPALLGNCWFPALRGAFRQIQQIIQKSSDQKIQLEKKRGFIYLRSISGSSRHFAARHFSGSSASNYSKIEIYMKMHQNSNYLYLHAKSLHFFAITCFICVLGGLIFLLDDSLDV